MSDYFMVRSAAMDDVASKLDRIASLLEALVTAQANIRPEANPTEAEEMPVSAPPPSPTQEGVAEGYMPEGIADEAPRVIKRGTQSGSRAPSRSSKSSGPSGGVVASAAHSSGSAAHSTGSAAHSSGSAAVPSTRISTATRPRPSLHGRFMKVVRPRKPLETFHQFSESYSAAPSVDEGEEGEPVVDDDTFIVKKLE